MASNCDQVRPLLAAYDEGDLAEAEAQRLERHLKACSACRQELSRMREAWHLLGQWPDLEPSPDYRARFWRRVAQEESRRLRWPGLLLGRRLAWAALVLLMAGSFYLGAAWRGQGQQADAPLPREAAALLPTVDLNPGGLQGVPDPLQAPSTDLPVPSLGQSSAPFSEEGIDRALAALGP
ncbi:MAG TPA: zf-HC2 domain-containing protein [Candidatus Nitrosotenuis sp.]|jgi:anti-sigma factor RsiW|nr:zf-HC2 domain-containing protein [Candidatus Nitrosotenuis sp.]